MFNQPSKFGKPLTNLTLYRVFIYFSLFVSPKHRKTRSFLNCERRYVFLLKTASINEHQLARVLDRNVVSFLQCPNQINVQYPFSSFTDYKIIHFIFFFISFRNLKQRAKPNLRRGRRIFANLCPAHNCRVFITINYATGS